MRRPNALPPPPALVAPGRPPPGLLDPLDRRQQDRRRARGDRLELRLGRGPRARRRRHPVRPQDDGGPARVGPEARGPAPRRLHRLRAVRVRLGPDGGRHRRGEGPRPGHGAARAGPQALPAGARTTACAASRWTSPACATRSPATRRPPWRGTKKEHVPLLYWTAMGWAGAMSLKVNDSEVSADQPIVEALARRALELDEGWGLGSIHEFFVSWESGALDDRRLGREGARALREGAPLLEGATGLPVPHLRRERQRREAGQGAVPGAAGEGPRDRREPARRPAPRQPPRPEARPLAARAAGRALHRVAGRTREDP